MITFLAANAFSPPISCGYLLLKSFRFRERSRASLPALNAGPIAIKLHFVEPPTAGRSRAGSAFIGSMKRSCLSRRASLSP